MNPKTTNNSDAAYEAYYRRGFMYSHGYDPLDPEVRYDTDAEQFDPEWDGWIKESEREVD